MPTSHRPRPRLRPDLLVILIAVIILVLPRFAAAQDTRNVLVLHSYHQGLNWTDRISAGIESQLRPLSGTIELHYEYLDTKRNAGDDYFERMAEFERFKVARTQIEFEVIISSDDNALRFLLEYGDELYPGVPVVFCGVNNYSPELLEGTDHITGVLETIDFAGTLSLMSRLHPDRDRVLVMVDATTTGHAVRRNFSRFAHVFADRLTCEIYQDFSLSEVADHVAELGSDTMIYLLTFNRDRHGRFISYLDGIRLIHGASKVPIYGSWEFYFGNGIVGGVITSGFHQGETAAGMALEILDGKSVSEIPVAHRGPNHPMFDHDEMARFGIDPSLLPENAVVINEPPDFMERHRTMFIGVMGLLLLVILALGSRLIHQRRHDLRELTTLTGLLPICAGCKKIRDDKGYWNQLESYIDGRSEASFSHSLCPTCAREYGPEKTGDRQSDPTDTDR